MSLHACPRVTVKDRARVASAPVEAIAEQLGLVNEFHARAGHPDLAIAYLKRVAAAPAQLDDPGLAEVAVRHLRAARAALANPETLPPSFRR